MSYSFLKLVIRKMQGFVHFLRTQGIAGLAIGFIIGSAAQDFVKSLSVNLLNPIVSKATGSIGNLQNALLFVMSTLLNIISEPFLEI